MANEKVLILCASLLACNGGESKVSATQGGFESGGGSLLSTTGDGTSGGSQETLTTDGDPGEPTSGPSGVTAGQGSDVTGNDATGSDATGNDATGNDATGEGGEQPGPGGTTGGADTGAPGTSAGGTTGDTGAGPGSGTSGDGQGEPKCVPLLCEGKKHDCGDCADNDGDGKVDLADPECVSPCDDREDTFATGIPGDNMDPCKQDCFFDGNSGAGVGDCLWNLKCDPKGPGGDSCPYDPKYKNCAQDQPQGCIDTCQVPNGCDCFGCCAVKVDGATVHIFLGDPDCALDQIDKPLTPG